MLTSSETTRSMTSMIFSHAKHAISNINHILTDDPVQAVRCKFNGGEIKTRVQSEYRACIRHRTSCITRSCGAVGIGGGEERQRVVRNRRARWGRDEMVMERFPRCRHRLGPEKNRLIRASGVRGLPRVSLCHRERTNNGIKKRPGSVSAHVSEKKANEPTGSYLVPGRFQFPFCVSLVAPVLLEAAPDLSLPLSLSFLNDLRSRDRLPDSPPFFDYYNAIRHGTPVRRKPMLLFPASFPRLMASFWWQRGKSNLQGLCTRESVSIPEGCRGRIRLVGYECSAHLSNYQDLWHKINTLNKHSIDLFVWLSRILHNLGYLKKIIDG